MEGLDELIWGKERGLGEKIQDEVMQNEDETWLEFKENVQLLKTKTNTNPEGQIVGKLQKGSIEKVQVLCSLEHAVLGICCKRRERVEMSYCQPSVFHKNKTKLPILC